MIDAKLPPIFDEDCPRGAPDHLHQAYQGITGELVSLQVGGK